MPRSRIFLATKITQAGPAGKKTKSKQKEDKEKKERKEVSKKGLVAEEVEQQNNCKQHGIDTKLALQHGNTQGAQRAKGKKTGIDQRVGGRADKKADVVQTKRKGPEPQIEQESNKGADHNDVARAKGKELLALLQSGSQNEGIVTEESADTEGSVQGENENNPDQIVIRRKNLYIQSLEKKISSIQSTLSMERQSLVTQIRFKDATLYQETLQRFALADEKNTMESKYNYERRYMAALIEMKDEAHKNDLAVLCTLKQELIANENIYNAERQSLVAQIADRDEALKKERQSLVAQIADRDEALTKEREEREALEQEMFQLESRYNEIASTTDYDVSYMEGKVQLLELELNKQVRAKEDLDAEIRMMKDKLEKFEQEKEEWEKREMEDKEKRMRDATQIRQIAVQCRLSREGAAMKEEFIQFEMKMKAYEEDIESKTLTIEPKLSTFEAMKLFANRKKIYELAIDVVPMVLQILDDNDIGDVDASVVLDFVRRSLTEDEDMTPEAMSVRIKELRENRDWTEVPHTPRSAPVQASRTPRPQHSSRQPKQPNNNAPVNSTTVRQPSSLLTNHQGSSRTLPSSSNTVMTNSAPRSQPTKKWHDIQKVREVNISERTCKICLDEIGDRAAIQCDKSSCREPLHVECAAELWKEDIEKCPTCQGPMPNRSEFPDLSRSTQLVKK